jgi:two-component system chemotaxis response regulator CheB
MIRVLVVDDSATARQLLIRILDSDPEIQVVGVAKSGQQAINLAKRLRPDVITMDLNLPDIDGFQATKEIMIVAPTPIVIVSASSKAREVDAAVQAMRAGALTLLLRPSSPASTNFDMEASEMLSTIKAMAEVKVVRHFCRKQADLPDQPPLSRPATIRAIAIAASTGGPLALQQLLCDLPVAFPVPILLVQHMPSQFSRSFAGWLDSVVPLHVQLATAGEPLAPATVYIAPEDRHLGVTRSGRATVLSDDQPIDGFRPSGSFLFRSVAEAFGDSAVGLIMTGMGSDGVNGLQTLHAAGGLVIAQSESTCVVFGMPGAAVAQGVVDRILPLEAMGRELARLVGG